MLFGGPFTFLAGLFGLGAAGVSYLVESAGREAENAAYRQRQREHNFAPADFQQELEKYAAFHQGYSSAYNNCMGFNKNKIRHLKMPYLYITKIDPLYQKRLLYTHLFHN